MPRLRFVGAEGRAQPVLGLCREESCAVDDAGGQLGDRDLCERGGGTGEKRDERQDECRPDRDLAKRRAGNVPAPPEPQNVISGGRSPTSARASKVGFTSAPMTIAVRFVGKERTRVL